MLIPRLGSLEEASATFSTWVIRFSTTSCTLRYVSYHPATRHHPSVGSGQSNDLFLLATISTYRATPVKSRKRQLGFHSGETHVSLTLRWGAITVAFFLACWVLLATFGLRVLVGRIGNVGRVVGRLECMFCTSLLGIWVLFVLALLGIYGGFCLFSRNLCI